MRAQRPLRRRGDPGGGANTGKGTVGEGCGKETKAVESLKVHQLAVPRLQKKKKEIQQATGGAAGSVTTFRAACQTGKTRRQQHVRAERARAFTSQCRTKQEMPRTRVESGASEAVRRQGAEHTVTHTHLEKSSNVRSKGHVGWGGLQERSQKVKSGGGPRAQQRQSNKKRRTEKKRKNKTVKESARHMTR